MSGDQPTDITHHHTKSLYPRGFCTAWWPFCGLLPRKGWGAGSDLAFNMSGRRRGVIPQTPGGGRGVPQTPTRKPTEKGLPRTCKGSIVKDTVSKFCRFPGPGGVFFFVAFSLSLFLAVCSSGGSLYIAVLQGLSAALCLQAVQSGGKNKNI